MPAAAYVIGSTPFGVIIARARGVDLRKSGSGNVGATNVARVLGRRLGMLCFVLDVMKGLLPTLAAGAVLRSGRDVPTTLHLSAWLGVAMGCILGHVFSFYLAFRGGKGVATSLGVVLGVFPYFTWPGLAALGVWVAVAAASRYVSLASIVAAAAFVAFFAAFNRNELDRLWPLGAFAAVIAGLIIFRHSSNIRRLLDGTENRIGQKAPPSPTPSE
ncbi:MAG: glycerol-3-phosphate 1-O-acyltransferase PlsY [Planctomycetes bacterium]|nr:glycerol-3-phosphate 1-O-acyltransferase PlsY [Planctomycetota bacterium]